MKNKTMGIIEMLGLKINEEVQGDIRRYTKLRLVDEDGYLYYLSCDNLNNSLRRGSSLAKFFHNNPFTMENISNYIRINIGSHIEICSFNGVKSAKDLFWLRCNKHNITYQKCWNVIKNGQYCNECGMEKYKERRKNDINEIKTLAREKYGIEIISDIYTNNIEPLEFICNKHKHKGVQHRSWANIISSTHSCKFCSSEAIIESNKITHDDFVSRITNECKVIVIGRYEACKSNILVQCKECGDKFYLRPDHILSGVGCGRCVKSNGEARICDVLKSLGIEFMREYKFGDCILNKRDMPFDFFLPSTNTCIEYDGIQHFEPVDIFGGEKQFAIQRKNDIFKDEYCKKNGVNLIRIPYWQYEDIEKILHKYFIGLNDL